MQSSGEGLGNDDDNASHLAHPVNTPVDQQRQRDPPPPPPQPRTVLSNPLDDDDDDDEDDEDEDDEEDEEEEGEGEEGEDEGGNQTSSLNEPNHASQQRNIPHPDTNCAL